MWTELSTRLRNGDVVRASVANYSVYAIVRNVFTDLFAHIIVY